MILASYSEFGGTLRPSQTLAWGLAKTVHYSCDRTATLSFGMQGIQPTGPRTNPTLYRAPSSNRRTRLHRFAAWMPHKASDAMCHDPRALLTGLTTLPTGHVRRLVRRFRSCFCGSLLHAAGGLRLLKNCFLFRFGRRTTLGLGRIGEFQGRH